MFEMKAVCSKINYRVCHPYKSTQATVQFINMRLCKTATEVNETMVGVLHATNFHSVYLYA